MSTAQSMREAEEAMRSNATYTEEEAAHFSKIREAMFTARHELRWSADNVLRTPETPLPKDYKSSGDILRAELPDEADQEKFWAYTHEGDAAQRRVTGVATAQQYLDVFSCTNYVDPKSVYELVSLLHSPVHLYIPVGKHLGFRYRLVPCSDVLEAKEDECDWDDTREFAEDSIIGVDIAPQRIRFQDAKRDGTAQRGTTSSDESNYTSSSGSSFTGNNLTGPYTIDVAKDKYWGLFHGHWEVNPPPRRQMAGIKIADRVKDLKEGKQFKMDEYFTTKYTVLQAVIQERGGGLSPVIIRQLPELNMDLNMDSSPDVSRLRIEDDY